MQVNKGDKASIGDGGFGYMANAGRHCASNAEIWALAPEIQKSRNPELLLIDTHTVALKS